MDVIKFHYSKKENNFTIEILVKFWDFLRQSRPIPKLTQFHPLWHAKKCIKCSLMENWAKNFTNDFKTQKRPQIHDRCEKLWKMSIKLPRCCHYTSWHALWHNIFNLFLACKSIHPYNFEIHTMSWKMCHLMIHADLEICALECM